MKSKRAEQVLDVASFTDEFDYQYVHFENACEAVELAEGDAEEEIEALKARAVRAFLMACSCGRDVCSYRAEGVGCTDYLRGHGCSQYSVFIQKLNER